MASTGNQPVGFDVIPRKLMGVFIFNLIEHVAVFCQFFAGNIATLACFGLGKLQVLFKGTGLFGRRVLILRTVRSPRRGHLIGWSSI